MRTLLLAALALSAGVAGSFLSVRVQPAEACSIAPFSERFMPDYIARAGVIAVGTLENPKDNAITLLVEEGLKGAAAGDRLTIDNATNMDCYEALEPGRQNYFEWAHVLVFLVPDTFGAAKYKVDRFGYDIFRVDSDALQPYMYDARQWPRIEAVRATFVAGADRLNDPGAKPIDPCSLSHAGQALVEPKFAELAEATIIGTVLGDQDGATAIRVDESFKGGLSGELTINDHGLNLQSDCQVTMNTGRRAWPVGARVAAMLVRDEFGVAQWRPAITGGAMWRVNDSEFVRYEGIPLLSEVRRAVEQAVPPPSDSGRSTPTETWVAVAVAALLALVLAPFAWIRNRR